MSRLRRALARVEADLAANDAARRGRVERRLGRDLKVGDTIETWWSPRRDTIVGLTPYEGPLSGVFPEGAQLAEFALSPTGMTIDNGDLYEVVLVGE